jgi:CheY-like chemotaxis protein
VSASEDRPLVIALCPDLMMRSRIESGLDIAGYRLRVVGGPARLDQALAEVTPACLLVDLEAGDDAVGLIARLRTDAATRDIPLAAFAGHTNVDVLDQARAAGADPVVARGQAAISTGKVVDAAIAAAGARP